MAQAQGIGRRDRDRSGRLAASGQDEMTSAEWTPSFSAVAQAVSTAGRPSLSTGQDIDHLHHPALRELPTHLVQCGRKDPTLEGCAEYRRAFDFLRFGGQAN
ncbi:hypothetical protein LMTR13_17260 [Bradyrhizobium icense]|uniref:Uncharacterized protein n=1 Tax=Bradyrhizobium icense TaxID=1274631 RepID=A0A1B1UFX8_9BRAD|nr:hypothetical protein LMTR13_17260 [Bradyrhizobium icense]